MKMVKWREKCFISNTTGDELLTNNFRSSSFRQLKLTEFDEHLCKYKLPTVHRTYSLRHSHFQKYFKSNVAIAICSRITNLENKSNLLKLSCALLRFWSPSTFDWKVFIFSHVLVSFLFLEFIENPFLLLLKIPQNCVLLLFYVWL